MTISPFLIYLFGIADNVSSASGIIFFSMAAITVFAGGLVMINTMSEYSLGLKFYDTFKTAFKRPLKIWFVVLFLSLFLSVFFPDRKTVAMMVVVPAIVNCEPIQKDIPELYQLAVETLKEKLVKEKKK